MAVAKPNTCLVCDGPKPTKQGYTCSALCLRAWRTKYLRARTQRIISANPEAFPCAMCGALLLSVSPTHLKRHGIATLSEYVAKYPQAKTATQQTRRKRGKSSRNRSNYLTYVGKEPDEKLAEFLIGTLLGDGNIARTDINCHARYAEGGNNREYMLWKYEFLKQYFHTTFQEKLSSPHTKTGKRYIGWWIRTSVHPYLSQLFMLWYPHGKKIVPIYEVIKHITPFSLSIWYCDDGNKRGYLYTLGFTNNEVGALRVILMNKLKLETRVVMIHNKPALFITAANRQRFGSLMTALPGMGYKFEVFKT